MGAEGDGEVCFFGTHGNVAENNGKWCRRAAEVSEDENCRRDVSSL